MFVMFSTFFPLVPSAPQSFDVERIRDSSSELQVFWEPPLEPNGIITSYKVYCWEKDNNSTSETSTHAQYDNNTVTKTVPGNSSETIVSYLTPYTFYECSITANTSAGEGNSSTTDIARTDESGKFDDQLKNFSYLLLFSCV